MTDSPATTEPKTGLFPRGLSEWALVAANLVPLLGVFAFGWSVFEVVVVYWIENLVVGAINVFRMLFAGGRPRPGEVIGRIFLCGFFIVHYGLFCFVHGVFVFVLLGKGSEAGNPFEIFANLGGHLDSHLFWGAAALAASHFVSLVVNYLGRGEYLHTDAGAQMGAPYPRMVALHIAIVFGAFFVQALGAPIVLLAILVIGKTGVDLKLHRKSHRAREANPAEP